MGPSYAANVLTDAVQYPIVMELQYKMRERTNRVGMGQTRGINSSFVVFTADQPIAVGSKLEIAIAWPVLLNQCVPLKLVVEAVVVSGEETLHTAKIVKYQFRTRKAPVASETGKAVAAAAGAAHRGVLVPNQREAALCLR